MPELNVEVLGRALAGVLLNAMEQGDKEGGWDNLWKFGPQKYARGAKDLTGVDAGQHAHGPGGLFSTPGIESLVVNAHMTPRDLDALLPVYSTVFMNPIYPSLMGFKEDAGEEPEGYCDDCLGGEIQGCEVTATFGHICRGSNEIYLLRTIQMINRGETTPLSLLGDILGPGGISRMPNTPTEWLEVVTRAEMVKVAVFLQRKIMKMTWNGNPARNHAGGGYKEFPGMEMLVGTGKVDLTTGTACDALDSFVMDSWNFQDIGAIQPNGYDIVGYLSTMEWYMYHNADRMGFMPVQWVFASTPTFWQELTSIWPCRYNTNRCAMPGNANFAPTLVGNEMIALRDQMRRSMTIEINGRTYPWIVCDGMTELHGNPGLPNFNANLQSGEFASSVFMLPLAVRNGVRTLYWEHLDYSKADAIIAETRSSNDFWTDGGRYFWTAERKRGCFKLNAEMDLRIILRTPHLAARLDNIRYTPLVHLRSPFAFIDQEAGAEDPYFKKGGVAHRADYTANWYTEWHTPQR